MESMNSEEGTLTHISHVHPLKLVPSPELRPICIACRTPCSDESYGCTDCQYFLHITCATTEQRMDHPSHPAHTLLFVLSRPYPGRYKCDGCGDEGNSFSLRCDECDFDLHLHCASLPHRVDHRSHDHLLTLVYENPYPRNMGYTCNQCLKDLDVHRWFYLCEYCNFGGHVECFTPEGLEVLSPGLQAPAEFPETQSTEHQIARSAYQRQAVRSEYQQQSARSAYQRQFISEYQQQAARSAYHRQGVGLTHVQQAAARSAYQRQEARLAYQQQAARLALQRQLARLPEGHHRVRQNGTNAQFELMFAQYSAQMLTEWGDWLVHFFCD